MRWAAVIVCAGMAGCTDGAGDDPCGDAPAPAREITCDHPRPYMANFAIKEVLLPTQRSDLAIDLNGDGLPDNQFGNLIGGLEFQGLDVQNSVDQSVTRGSLSLLLQLHYSDAAFANDSTPYVEIFVGKGFEGTLDDGGVGCTGCPDFSGKGTFTIDAAQPLSMFRGRIADGKFASESPVTTRIPQFQALRLALFPGAPPVSLFINGAHLQFTIGGDGTLSGGQLHGSIKNSDVQGVIVPQLAAALSKAIGADACAGAESQRLAGLFDTGNCTNADGTKAKAGDCRLDPCEIAGNPIFQQQLQPDVQIYSDAASTVYAPNPKNTMRDSLSLGIGFTAVSARF